MNNKTMIKVINGMSDKIDGLEEKINNIDNIMVEQYDLLYNKIEGLTNVADNNTGLIASINDDFNNMIKEGHETLKRVKNNKMEGK